MTSFPKPNQPSENIHLEFDVDVPAGENLEIIVNATGKTGGLPENGDILIQLNRSSAGRFSLKQIARSIKSAFYRLRATPLPFSERWFFIIALTVYLFTRLIALEDFPLSFTADEAAASVAASELLELRLHGADGAFLPTFFSDGQALTLGTSVYLRAVWEVLFGQSLWLARLFGVISSLLVVWGLTDWLKNGFRIKCWWVTPLILATSPGWFIPSRSALDTMLLTALYVASLTVYLQYRQGNPGSLYTAVVLAALTFYTSPPARILIPLLILIILVIDLPYHRKRSPSWWRIAFLLFILALPLLRFLWTAPADILTIDWLLPGSIWSDPKPPEIGLFYLQRTLQMLNPVTWFLPHPVSTSAYILPLHGALGWISFPFLLIGLWQTLKQARQSPPALVSLIGFLVAPVAFACFEDFQTGTLPMLPFWLLFTILGLERCLRWLEQYRPRLRLGVPYLLMIGLSVGSAAILLDVLHNAPRWYPDYGRNGLQYGAGQVFRLARNYAARHPETTIRITPIWCMRCETLRAFFIPNNPKILFDLPYSFLESAGDTITSNVFIVTREEYLAIVESKRFSEVNVEAIIPFPDGFPAFFLLRLNDRAEAFSEKTSSVVVNRPGPPCDIPGDSVF